MLLSLCNPQAPHTQVHPTEQKAHQQPTRTCRTLQLCIVHSLGMYVSKLSFKPSVARCVLYCIAAASTEVMALCDRSNVLIVTCGGSTCAPMDVIWLYLPPARKPV